MLGIGAASEKSEYFAVHDGARPFIDPHDIERVIQDAKRYGAATLGVPVKDTIKVVAENGFIERTPERSMLFYNADTSGVSSRNISAGVAAAKRNGLNFTDDCQLVEYAGHKVYMTKGNYQNIKLTTKDDILVAKAFTKEE